MSLLGSLNAAVGGLNAQSAALSSISDNVANSQTVGFKGTNTAFVNYVTQSDANTRAPGAVVARPQYTNSLQGAVLQVNSPTSLAVAGAGFFAVQRPIGGGAFDPQPYYTRVGDFTPNREGLLINSAGYALDGWRSLDMEGSAFDVERTGPIQINKAPSVPVPTSELGLAANLPPKLPPGETSFTSKFQAFDAGGNARDVVMTWTNPAAATATTPATWDLEVTSPLPTSATLAGPMRLTFGNTPGTAGTVVGMANIRASTGAPAVQTDGAPATLNLAADFGYGTQNIALNLGNFGRPNGITQFAGEEYEVASRTQNGAPQGNYSSVTVRPTGDVVINYDNGQMATVARIPLVSFNNANALQQEDGQAFTATIDSGVPNTISAGAGGTGTLVVGAQEGSNVDIASEFTDMIVAQRAYTANTKIVSVTNQLLQDTLNMVQA